MGIFFCAFSRYFCIYFLTVGLIAIAIATAWPNKLAGLNSKSSIRIFHSQHSSNILDQLGGGESIMDRFGIIRDRFKPRKPNGRFVFARLREKVKQKKDLVDLFTFLCIFCEFSGVGGSIAIAKGPIVKKYTPKYTENAQKNIPKTIAAPWGPARATRLGPRPRSEAALVWVYFSVHFLDILAYIL